MLLAGNFAIPIVSLKTSSPGPPAALSSPPSLQKKNMSSVCLTIAFIVTCLLSLLSWAKGERQVRSSGAAGAQEKSVCYGRLGCFSNAPPFSSDIPLPQPRKRINTTFHLRTRSNPVQSHVLKPGRPETLRRSNYESGVMTRIILHGYSMYGTLEPWINTMVQAILAKDDSNVIVVDWMKGAMATYSQAVGNTRLVGAEVANLIKWLMDKTGNPLDSFHIIGFSLGAQVAGYAGDRLGGRIARISAVDPANPGFKDTDPRVHLDPSDAMFVDAIHTDGNTLLGVGLGMKDAIGHVDFYPNGGNDQPGCNMASSSEGSILYKLSVTFSCDHFRAADLYIATINATNGPLQGFQCDNYDRFRQGTCMSCRGNRCRSMGWDAERVAHKERVKFYLQTTAEDPFKVYHYQVKMHFRNVSRAKEVDAKLYIQLRGPEGETEEVALKEGNQVRIVPGHSQKFLFSTPTHLSKVESVSFRWEEVTSSSSWWFSSWFGAEEEDSGEKTLHVKSVKLKPGEADVQTRSHYCLSRPHRGILAKETKMFRSCIRRAA
ncbi:endothelial lipase-like isoform X1 [Branchiostoma floridae x Branchiostoma belcheri]